MLDKWTVVTAAILAVCTIMAVIRLYAFDEQMRWLRKNDTPTPGSPSEGISSYWTLQDDRKLWMVYGWWLSLPIIGIVVGFLPSMGFVGLMCAVLCAACPWRAWALHRAMNQYRDNFVTYWAQYRT